MVGEIDVRCVNRRIAERAAFRRCTIVASEGFAESRGGNCRAFDGENRSVVVSDCADGTGWENDRRPPTASVSFACLCYAARARHESTAQICRATLAPKVSVPYDREPRIVGGAERIDNLRAVRARNVAKRAKPNEARAR
jgi:hypothetical protein